MIRLLAENPKVDEKLYEEINEELIPNDDSLPSFDLLMKSGAKYLTGVLNEVLRLRPPVPIGSKLVRESCVLPGILFPPSPPRETINQSFHLFLDGTSLEAGMCVFYSSYYMGRKASYWGSDVLEFKPERWLASKEPPTPFEYPVFNAGPR